FVLMGAFAERSGLARDLFALCSILVGRMRGGLGISVIGACSIFGALLSPSAFSWIGANPGLRVWPALLVILVVLGGIYSGIFTATEAAGVGAVLMLLAGLMQRRLRWSDFAHSLVETATTSAMIFAVLLGAEVFNAFLALTQMPE